MRWPAAIPEFPLLRRELTELAQRRRTYVLRTLGAVVLLAIAMLIYAEARTATMARGRAAAAVTGVPMNAAMNDFGMGGTIFERLVPFLFWTVDLLMPALCCAAVTSEKERNTLGNLFLTRLSPMMLLLEKLGSRLVPMFTLLLLTLPVLAFVYSLGGVDTTILAATLWLLFWECVLLATIGLFCSCWFPTTVAAFIWSYVLVGLLLMITQTTGIWIAIPRAVWAMAQNDPSLRFGTQAAAFAPGAGASVAGLDFPMLARVLAATLPAMVICFVFLMLARACLVRRAFVSSGSLLLKLFGRIDAFFVRLNEATTRGIEVFPDTRTLPGFDPVAWRERTRKSLGKARYLFRILVVTEGPTLFICVLAAQATSMTAFSGLRVLFSILWVVTGMIICVKAGTLVSSEFSRETIASLLSTPMSARDILLQKVAGMRRLLIVLAIPLLSVNLSLLLLHVDLSGSLKTGGLNVVLRAGGYLILTVTSTAVVMLVLTWLSALVGMTTHRQTRSILFAVIANSFLVCLPLVVDAVLNVMSSGQIARWAPFRLLVLAISPAQLIRCVDEWLLATTTSESISSYFLLFGTDNVPEVIFVVACGLLLLQVVVLLLLRRFTLRIAPRLLQRHEQPAAAPVTPRPLARATVGSPLSGRPRHPETADGGVHH